MDGHTLACPAAVASLRKEAGLHGGRMARKRKREGSGEAAEAAGADVTDPEAQRKQAQRAIQQLVVRLRKEGKSEKEIKAAKYALKEGGTLGATRPTDSKRAKKAEAWRKQQELEGATPEEKKKAFQEKRKEGLSKEHELVIIPVVWRGRADKEEVQKAAEAVKDCVAQQGVDVWLDSRRQYTPGQKFAHWEHRGVMLRVEVGPEDVTAGVCRVCRAFVPGEHTSVERRKVALPPQGGRKLLLVLREWGLKQINVELRAGETLDDSDLEDIAPGTEKARAAAAAPSRGDDLDGNWAPRTAKGEAEKNGEPDAKKRKKAKR